MKPLQFVLDAIVVLGLFCALVLVFVLDPRATENREFAGPELDYKVISGEAKLEHKPLKLAVSSPPKYDDMSLLLTKMGEGYRHSQIPVNDARKLDELNKYDVVFYTCEQSNANDFTLNHALRQFVERGGTLYASDLRFDALRGAFPEYTLDFGDLPPPGEAQTLNAHIADPGLEKMVESDKIKITFDLRGWKPAAFRRDKTTVYLEGEYLPLPPNPRQTSPLLVSFPFGKGAVVFTSFHNAKQRDEKFETLLKYVVLRVVTAREEALATKNLLEGGLKPAQSSLISVNPQQPTATSRYDHTKDGKLRFVLVFNPGQGAELEMKLLSPDGKLAKAKGEGTFTIEVPQAKAGTWEITVTALRLPYPDFPFTVTVAEPKE